MTNPLPVRPTRSRSVPPPHRRTLRLLRSADQTRWAESSPAEQAAFHEQAESRRKMQEVSKPSSNSCRVAARASRATMLQSTLGSRLYFQRAARACASAAATRALRTHSFSWLRLSARWLGVAGPLVQHPRSSWSRGPSALAISCSSCTRGVMMQRLCRVHFFRGFIKATRAIYSTWPYLKQPRSLRIQTGWLTLSQIWQPAMPMPLPI